MKYTPLALEGVWLIEPQRHGDSRGYFCETFRADSFEAATGIRPNFVQDNESVSRRGVVRGLHYQAGEASQAKLVRVTSGCIVDVAVDLRRSSPTFGRHICVELSADNGCQLYIPVVSHMDLRCFPRVPSFNIRSIITIIPPQSDRCASTIRRWVWSGLSPNRI